MMGPEFLHSLLQGHRVRKLDARRSAQRLDMPVERRVDSIDSANGPPSAQQTFGVGQSTTDDITGAHRLDLRIRNCRFSVEFGDPSLDLGLELGACFRSAIHGKALKDASQDPRLSISRLSREDLDEPLARRASKFIWEDVVNVAIFGVELGVCPVGEVAKVTAFDTDVSTDDLHHLLLGECHYSVPAFDPDGLLSTLDVIALFRPRSSAQTEEPIEKP